MSFFVLSINTTRIISVKPTNSLVCMNSYSKTNGRKSPTVMSFPSLLLKMSHFITDLSDVKTV